MNLIHMLADLKSIYFIGHPLIIYKPDLDLSHELDEVYKGNIHADELKIWAQEKCIPLVRLVKIKIKTKRTLKAKNVCNYCKNICVECLSQCQNGIVI